MKKNYILGLLFLLVANVLFAQNYYYYKGEKQFLTLDKSGFDIYVNNNFQTSQISNNNLEPYNLSVIHGNEKFATIDFMVTPNSVDYYTKINELKSANNLTSVQPRFISAETDTLRLSNYLFVKLKNSNDLNLLHNIATNKHFTVVGPNQFMPLWYKLKCDKNTLGNPLEIANYLFETGNFAAAQPDFLILNNENEENEPQSIVGNNPPYNSNTGTYTVCANDTNFPQQWGLENQTNTNIDIDICNAWTISEGLGVKVAVLDGGIDFNNLDLNNNILPLSYDTVTGTSPSVMRSPHGIFVSGIIGAVKNNNYQIVGVAPQSKLISISTDGLSNITSVEQRANGINWAWQNGADIINNSWTASYFSDLLDDAIENALTFGRNGLGTIVIFIAGNSKKPQNPNTFGIYYPANSNDGITVVGAAKNDGSRGFFSCYGSKLDVVAPGVDVISTYTNNTLQTDSDFFRSPACCRHLCFDIICKSLFKRKAGE